MNIIAWKTKDMHERHEGDLERTIRAIPVIVKELRKNGYEFMTVTELANKKGITLQAANYYESFR